ncbi:MAG: hypothetical protein MUF31_16630 [Akkermansiaceae bacterium]|jgi:hypothetical protein|nr:hypothetical protein [Akkermansiaceae bacterium]
MKRRYRLFGSLAVVPALLVTGCEKKEQAKTETVVEKAVEKAAETVEKAVETVVPAVPAISTEERAAMIGIGAHLSPDVEAVASVMGGRDAMKALGELDTWGFIREVAKEENGMDPQDQITEGAASVDPFLGDEFSLVFGSGWSETLTLYMKFAQRLNYHQARAIGQAFAQGAVGGDFEESFETFQSGDWMSGMMEEVGPMSEEFEAFKVPAILGALRIKDEEARKAGLEQISGFSSMIGEGAEPIAFEKAGASFSGIRFSGEMMAAGLEEEREEMTRDLGEEAVERIINKVKTLNVVIASATKDEYLLLYIGGSEEDCPLVSEVSESLAASPAISFIDGFKGKPVHGLLYGSDKVIGTTVKGSLKGMAEGVRDGLGDVKEFGDARELVGLLDLVGEKESALLDLYTPGTLGGVISVDNGLKFDTFGGGDPGHLSKDRKHGLAGLGEGENVLLFADITADPEYSERASDMLDLLVTIGYAAVEHGAGLEAASEQSAQFQQFFQMFDGSFREDVLQLAGGLSMLGEGLGDESAFVVDLSAKFPPIPGVPAEIVEESRFPRISWVAPVTDRSKVAASWKEIDTSVRDVLKTLREMEMGEINMLDPTSAEKDDMITWYFDALAFSDDLKPSVTLNDSWFAASTSRTQAQELIAKATAGAAPERSGAWFKLDLDVLRVFVEESVTIADKHGEKMGMGEGELAALRENLPMVRDGLKALEEFNAVTIHERHEGGIRRATLHFQMD